MKIRTYSDLLQFPIFEERYRYLQLNGAVGEETFGFDRYINQMFYGSKQWKAVRDRVIIRDNGCDLGIEGRDIRGKIIIHHMNPITKKDLETMSDYLLNPEYLVCVTPDTHNAIHYGDEGQLIKPTIERAPNDTCPWKQKKEMIHR